MNTTRHVWSKTYNCSLKHEENVPVIAVSSFMLFLPLIFYLSNYLHSEQKKRKLIHRECLWVLGERGEGRGRKAGGLFDETVKEEVVTDSQAFASYLGIRSESVVGP